LKTQVKPAPGISGQIQQLIKALNDGMGAVTNVINEPLLNLIGLITKQVLRDAGRDHDGRYGASELMGQDIYKHDPVFGFLFQLLALMLFFS
jgi:hypothetical protein